MPLGDMKLAIDLGLNLSGFEQLANIAKSLEALHQMAGLVQTGFSQMASGINHSLSGVSSQISQVTNQLDRAAQAARNFQASGGTPGFLRPSVSLPQSKASGGTPGFLRPSVSLPQSGASGGTPGFIHVRPNFPEERLAPSADGMRSAMIAEAQRKQNEAAALHARALRDSERAIRAETETREKAWAGFKSGIFGAIGLSASFGLIEAGKSFIKSAAQMDDRRSSMRLQGLDPNQTSRMTSMALQANVPGLDLAEKVLLAQQIGTAVGMPKVTPESMRTIGVMARAITQHSGGDLKETIPNLVQASQSVGGLIGKNGLDAGRLGDNSEALEHIMALAPGRIPLEHLNEMLGAGRAGLQGLDLAHNQSLQSHIALLTESKGVTPEVFNEMLRFLQGGLDQKSLGPFAQAGLLKMQPGGVLPTTNPLTGKTNVRAVDLLDIPKTGDPFDFFPMAVAKLHEKFPHTPIQNLINAAFPVHITKGVSALATPTAIEEHQRNLEALKRQPQGTENIFKATESFNQAVIDIEKAFREFSQVVGAPLVQDAAAILEMIQHGLHGLSVVLGALGPVLPILVRLVEALSILAGIRFLGTKLAGGAAAGLVGGAMLGAKGGGGGASNAAAGLVGGAMLGAKSAPAATSAAPPPRAAGTGMMAQMEFAAAGAIASTKAAVDGAIASTKAMALKVASRGLIAAAVASVVDAVVDSFTTEDSTINSLMKDAIEGSTIGYAVRGWQGALIGAILDPLTKHVLIPAAKKFDQDYGKVYAKKFDEDFKESMQHNLSDDFVPMVGEPMMPIPGFTNADALKRTTTPGDTSTLIENKATSIGHRPTGPRTMTVTHSANSMLPPTGPVQQTNFDSALAKGLAAQHEQQEQRNQEREAHQRQEQFLNRLGRPVAPPKLISPTGVNTPIGATPEIPSAAGPQSKQIEALPSLKVGTIETNMLIVRGGQPQGGGGQPQGRGGQPQGGGGQPQVGTTATEGAGTTPSSAGTTTPGLPKSSATTSSATMIAGEPVAPDRPLSAAQMGAIDTSTKMGNTYPPEIMAQYNQQKGIAQSANGAPSALQSLAPGEPDVGSKSQAGIASSSQGGATTAPSALQLLAPGEPDVGLGSMTGSKPQTGVTPGLPGTAPTTSKMMGGGSTSGEPDVGSKSQAGIASGQGGATTAPSALQSSQAGIASSSQGGATTAPSALQMLAPGEPDVGLGSMTGSKPQTGVTPGLPGTAPTTSKLMGGGSTDPTTRMAGHRMPAGVHGSNPIVHQGNATDPRGIRNNNPGNLTFRPGQGAVGSDGRFGVFKTMEEGVAANVRQMAFNQDRHGINTIRGMIGRWSPPGENNTEAYIKSVSGKLGVGADAPINFHDPKVDAVMMQAISGVENGRTLDQGVVNKGVGMALGTPPKIQGPQVNPDQADIPSNHMVVHINSQHLLDGDMMAEHMATHFIGGGATASPSATGYDSKMHPLTPGVSVPRW